MLFIRSLQQQRTILQHCLRQQQQQRQWQLRTGTNRTRSVYSATTTTTNTTPHVSLLLNHDESYSALNNTNIGTNYHHQRMYNTTTKLSMVLKDGDDDNRDNDNGSDNDKETKTKATTLVQDEQERIKTELSTQTGANDAHLQIVNELTEQTDIMNSLLHDNGGSTSSDSDENGNGNENDEKKKIQQMNIVSQLHWKLGMLDDAQSLQEDILSRLIQYHNNKNNDSNSTSSSKNNNNLPQHMDIAKTIHTIGAIQSRMNHPLDAKKWFDASLKMKEEILCKSQGFEYHYEIGKTINGLALVEIQLNEDDHDNNIDVNDNDADTNSGVRGQASLGILSLFETAEKHYLFHGERINNNDNNNNAETDVHNHDQKQKEEDELIIMDDYKGDSIADHPHVGSINENIATLYRKHGDYNMALTKYEEALRIQMLWTSKSTPEIVGLNMDLGDCFKALRRYEEALERYEEALRLHMLIIRKERQRQYKKMRNGSEQEQARGDDDNSNNNALVNPIEDLLPSPIEGILRHNMGMMHAQVGRHEQAMEEYQSSLRIKKRIDETHPEVAMTLSGIGALEATLGEYDSALAYFREALHVFRLHSTSLFGFGEDVDENIFQAKKNIEMVEKQMSGFGGRGI